MKKSNKQTTTCTIGGCNKKIAYAERQICQMHYFRYMRNNTYDTIKKRTYRTLHSNGYIKLYEPDHELSASDGNIYEHRYVYYEKISKTISECEMCGKEINWKIGHIDHIDENRSNNNEENLRPLCNGCNVYRNRKLDSNVKCLVTYKNRTMSCHAWGRQPDVKVSGHTIRRRIDKGQSPKEAI